jgi:Holliday junction resolvase
MNNARKKGNRIERYLVALHKAIGVPCWRVPLSGSVAGFKGDLRIGEGTTELRGEVKARAKGQGFRLLEKWLLGNDVLFIKRDRQAPLVVMEWTTYAGLLDTELPGNTEPELLP